MNIVTIIKRFGVTVGATAAIAAPFAASAQSGFSSQAIAVRVPVELCTVEERYRTNLYKILAGRSDFNSLLDHMLSECPELALGLADYATAEIETPDDRRGDDRTSTIPDRNPGPKARDDDPRDDEPGEDDEDDKDEPKGEEKPGKEEPKGEKPGKEEPKGEKPGKEEPKGEKPGKEEPKGEKREREERRERREEPARAE